MLFLHFAMITYVEIKLFENGFKYWLNLYPSIEQNYTCTRLVMSFHPSAPMFVAKW